MLGRSQSVWVGKSISASFPVISVVPQGSVFRPTLLYIQGGPKNGTFLYALTCQILTDFQKKGENL